MPQFSFLAEWCPNLTFGLAVSIQSIKGDAIVSLQVLVSTFHLMTPLFVHTPHHKV